MLHYKPIALYYATAFTAICSISLQITPDNIGNIFAVGEKLGLVSFMLIAIWYVNNTKKEMKEDYEKRIERLENQIQTNSKDVLESLIIKLQQSQPK
jgi:NADH:ubiquinone oxidoreductase subunit 5 (subunit L)/multisubunit Na+/H+ antiporter MnhA subunit